MPLLFSATGLGVLVLLEIWLRRQGFRLGASPPRRVEHAFHRQATRSFTGGLRSGLFNATWPLARLTLDGEAARIRVLLLRTVWVERSEVVAVRRLSFLLSPGILFETKDGAYDGVIFWTFAPSDVMRAFAALGWPVEGTAKVR